MKTTLLLATAFLSGLGAAEVPAEKDVLRNCTPKLLYCGQVLLRIGNYFNQINDALRASGQPTDQGHINNGLFYCTGGSNGEIKFQTYCGGGCVDGGGGNSDHC
ncbi:hypothetical protein BT63DRAFT_425472 [Microthyrium microscopicum]|uniref:Killer toxin Kp4 domain-containing protein n=1 Tax=Microthyrium microscopicum TaxID=703497 RepID=A0A6A6U969_9PEZI|nr:hypothetical protein BT63DRAFT_425472 [Microthyrium microscopicum]